jgi:hypothetical protein
MTDTYIASIDEHITDEIETAALTADYIARKSAATDAEYGWPAGTTARLWETQHQRWLEFDGTVPMP